MSSIFTNVLSNEELNYLNTRPEVLAAKASLDSQPSGMVYFSVPITNSIRATLQSRFGLHLFVDSQIPMRWIKGDTAPHVDTGSSHFKNTYLLYLNDSPGELVVDSQSYPIKYNTGFVFNEGLSHKTQYTENVPRLLLGPMNELVEPVGGPLYGIQYYPTEADALANTNSYGYSGYQEYEVGASGPFGPGPVGYTSWRIASNSTGSSSQALVYANGSVLNGGIALNAIYYLYPAGPDSTLFYYLSENDALYNTGSSYIAYGGTTVASEGGYNSWRLASNSTGTSSQSVVYNVGDVLNNDGNYYLYPSAPCFLEGSTILCQVNGIEKYVPVEQLNKGTLVKTSLDGYKPIVLIGKGTIQNPGDDERIEQRLYKCSTSKYPQLNYDLYITGCHSILEFPITEKQEEDTIKHLGKLFVTDKKYRLMACLDDRAEPWNSKGEYTVWHFALENRDEKMNYGVYANGGLLVESCNISFLKHKSNMTVN